MAGGLTQLVAYGQANLYLNGNPSMTFFKKVYKTHTNFAMESISLVMNKSDVNIYDPTQLRVKIDRHADLVGQMYLVFELPDILSDNLYRFRWVENIGEAIINEVYVSINGTIIDKQSGEYIHIMNSLRFGVDKKELYNKMIGNVMEYTNPEYNYFMQNFSGYNPQRYRVGNEYPISNDPNVPSIRSRKVYVPLTFWFNLDTALALPLVSLQFSEIELVFELRPIYELYRISYKKGNTIAYFAPDINNPDHRLHNFVTNGNKQYVIGQNILDIRANIEANYYYLDSKERVYFAYKPIEYLIQQVTRIPRPGLSEHNILELILTNPLKEIVWVVKRNDLVVHNNWFDFQDKHRHIMKSAKLMFNGMDRFSEKTHEYFSYIQPFQHHSGSSKEGIYMYSFSLYPEEYQPSGAANASKINKIQMAMELITPKTPYYMYDATFYVTSYNIVRISNGLCGLVYSL
jgi:hypothetical protein